MIKKEKKEGNNAAILIQSVFGDQTENPLSEHLTSNESDATSDQDFESRVQPEKPQQYLMPYRKQRSSDNQIRGGAGGHYGTSSTPSMTPQDGSEIVKWQVSRHVNSASF